MKTTYLIGFTIISLTAYKFCDGTYKLKTREDGVLQIEEKSEVPHVIVTKGKRSVSLVKGHRAALPADEMKPAYRLTGTCSNVIIREWNTKFGTDRTEEAKDIIQKTCEVAKEKYLPFVESKGYYIHNRTPVYTVYVSLLPWDKNRGGRAYRGLNDTTWRFFDRSSYCDSAGRRCKEGETPLDLSGLSDRDEGWLYVLNEIIPESWRVPFVPSWQAIFVHEMFHHMNWRSGVFHRYPRSSMMEKNALDEKNAREFIEYCGYRE